MFTALLKIAPPYKNINPSSVYPFDRSFVRACVSHHITREKKEGSKSTCQTGARQGQRAKTETVQTKKDHHVETNKQTNKQTNRQTTIKLATYLLRFIIYGYPYASVVIVCSFVRSFVHASIIISQERKKEGE